MCPFAQHTSHVRVPEFSEECLKQDRAIIKGGRVLVVSLCVYLRLWTTDMPIWRVTHGTTNLDRAIFRGRRFDLLFLGMSLRHETVVLAGRLISKISSMSTDPCANYQRRV